MIFSGRAKLGLAAIAGIVVMSGCGDGSGADSSGESAGSGDSSGENSGSGTVEVRANGEDFVRQGFTTKDGWDITFDNVYVTLSEVTAHQSDPAFSADNGDEGIESDEQVALDEVYTVDLASGGEDAETIEVGAVEDAPAGLYNSLSWQMVPAQSGPSEGASVMVVGKAQKDGESIDFSIPVEEEYEYLCGEFVGDERKGVLEDGASTDLEATFHFDHIFGDGDAPPDDDINTGAIGFDPLAEMAEGGELDTSLSELESGLSSEDYELLMAELPTLGHTGEGHCLETNSGSTG